MKRMKRILIFLFFIMLFIPFTVVHADPTCAEIREKAEKYNDVEDKLEKLNCSKSYQEDTTVECNKLSLQKNLLLTDLYEIYDMDVDCDKSIIKPIVENNRGVCSNEISSTVNSFAKLLLKNFYVIGTILFIIFGSLDFFKNIVTADPKEMPKNRRNFLKRAIALILLFFLPLIINLIFMFLPNHYRLGTNKYVCNAKSYYTKDKEANVISGYYSKSLITVSPKGGGASGKAIAEAARQIKKHTVEKQYYWGCNYQGFKQPSSVTDRLHYMCCAELPTAALYKAGIYDEATLKKLYSASAGITFRNFQAHGWILITDPDQLEPGDLLFYHNFGCSKPGCGWGKINGKLVYIGHVDIYYGDGKKVSTGGDVWGRLINGHDGAFTKELSNFKAKTSSQEFVGALRYPGK